MDISFNKYYEVKIGSSYVYLHDLGGFRTCKRKGSIISGNKLLRQKFNVPLAIESGLLSITEVEYKEELV